MDVAVKGRNISVTEALERHALEKVERVRKFFDAENSDCRAEVELIHQRNSSIPDPNVAEVTMFINGTVLKAREASADMYASIDLMSDKLERQVKRYRGRQIDRWQGKKGAAATPPGTPEVASPVGEVADDLPGDVAPAPEAAPYLGPEKKIVRTKQFQMKPMDPEEAALQMELLDHSFFVFTSADTGDINVVYRRRDGNYGLIEPVM
ncbi:MAG: ribosome-associated translation inhibitor RaiA [Rubrobacter sp.]|jgi:putative sigma-54 modulation protein|nr:ribosome-associated translation inhibitor RaiA [Rubrobacter sp.]